MTGNWVTAGAHIITAVIGSGVLSLAWAISTMGWAAGPLILFIFAFITWYMSLLLADAYRNPKVTGKRNYTYPGAVSAILGELLPELSYLHCLSSNNADMCTCLVCLLSSAFLLCSAIFSF